MVEVSQHQRVGFSPQSLLREVTLVFLLHLGLIVAAVRLGESLGMLGAVPALAAIIFVALPVLVLDRRGRPYARYGFTYDHPVRDSVWALLLALAVFPPIVAGLYVFPQLWGLSSFDFSWRWPQGYPMAVLDTLLVVALPEEVFYRGYLMSRLDDALLLQAVAFALGHYLVDFAPARLLVVFPALAFGWLRARTGSIVGPTVLHAASNAFMETFRVGLGLGA
jgi:membrane protease YdiL (CAAX protease family)